MFLQELSDQTGSDFDNADVRWVITVPAIWKMPAKQFMREAAYKVGLPTPSDTHSLQSPTVEHASPSPPQFMSEVGSNRDGGSCLFFHH